MAFDPETKLSDVLAGGYHLTAKLVALLGRPRDNRGQEEAMAISQELSRVFMISMSMLKDDDSKRTLKMAPESRAGDSLGVWSTLAKDNCVVRYYYRCHDRRCNAKKKVQQQDGSGGDDAPLFEVTYVNDHTCQHDAIANGVGVPDKSLPLMTTWRSPHLVGALENTSRNGGALFDDLRHLGGGAKENEAIVSCLAAVIRGTPPPGAEAMSARGPANVPRQLPAGGRQQADDGGTADHGDATMIDTGGFSFSWDDDPSSSSFWPADDEAMMDLCDDNDVHMDAARFVDTVCPRYYTWNK